MAASAHPLWEVSKVLAGQHPAKRISDSDFIDLVLERVAKSYIKKSDHDFLSVLNYNEHVSSKFFDEIVWSCRGLVINNKSKKILSLPFPKFWNWHEVGKVKFDITKVEVTEKMDGSLGSIFFCDDLNEWLVNTRGTFKSEQAVWAQNYIKKNIKTDLLTKGHTYLVEIIAPLTGGFREIVSYSSDCLVMIACYDQNGYEVPSCILKDLAFNAGFNFVKEHKFSSFDEFLDCVTKRPIEFEGMVVKLESGERLKFKGETYLEIQNYVTRELTFEKTLRETELIFKGKELSYSDFIDHIEKIIKQINDPERLMCFKETVKKEKQEQLDKYLLKYKEFLLFLDEMISEFKAFKTKYSSEFTGKDERVVAKFIAGNVLKSCVGYYRRALTCSDQSLQDIFILAAVKNF